MARARELPLTAQERASLAGRLRSARWAAGYTQGSVAAAIGASRNSVVNWESARAAPLAEARAKLAVLFGVHEELLFVEHATHLRRARALFEPVAVTVMAGEASACVPLGPGNELCGVLTELRDWAKSVQGRIDQLEWEVGDLRQALDDHREELGSPNGFAHAEVIRARTGEDSWDEVLVVSDAESRLALLEQRLGAVTATVRTMLAALGTMSEVLAEDG